MVVIIVDGLCNDDIEKRIKEGSDDEDDEDNHLKKE